MNAMDDIDIASPSAIRLSVHGTPILYQTVKRDSQLFHRRIAPAFSFSDK